MGKYKKKTEKRLHPTITLPCNNFFLHPKRCSFPPMGEETATTLPTSTTATTPPTSTCLQTFPIQITQMQITQHKAKAQRPEITNGVKQPPSRTNFMFSARCVETLTCVDPAPAAAQTHRHPPIQICVIRHAHCKHVLRKMICALSCRWVKSDPPTTWTARLGNF